MAEDRMLSDEILLGLIKKNGGSGGTTDYENLENLPEINGVELKGNKTLSDLGIASAQDLAAKQDALTAGDYISIANDEISVDREIPSVIAEYEIKTEPMVEGQAFISVTKTVNGEVVLTQKYGSSTSGIRQGINFDDNIYVDYSKTAAWSWTYKLRNASVDHAADYTQSWHYTSTVDYTEEFYVTDHRGDKLVIKSELDTALETKQDTLTFDDTPTDGSNNPVKSNGIYDALATKANTDMVAADFNTGTSYTAGNYCVQDGKLYKFKANHSGAWSAADVDEVKITGELSALKSGLTGLLKRGFFAITCTSGINILSRDTAVLHSGSLPTSDFTSCVFMVINHSTVQDAPNTVEADGGNTLIINAVSGQILSIVWLDFSNVPS